jgi:hypothetical protein
MTNVTPALSHAAETTNLRVVPLRLLTIKKVIVFLSKTRFLSVSEIEP